MHLEHKHFTGLAAIWISGTLMGGMVIGLTSPASWAALSMVALLPPVLAYRLQAGPVPTMSESIHEARR